MTILNWFDPKRGYSNKSGLACIAIFISFFNQIVSRVKTTIIMTHFITNSDKITKHSYAHVIASDSVINKNLFLETKFTEEGKPSTVIILTHLGVKIDSYWGLPMAIEAYNRI